MLPRTEAHVLLFDDGCRLCSSMARWVKRMDWRDRIRIRPIQESQVLIPSAPGRLPLDTMHVIRPGGEIASGGDALPALAAGLWSGPELERILRASPGAVFATRRFYALLVKLRGRLTCRTSSASS